MMGFAGRNHMKLNGLMLLLVAQPMIRKSLSTGVALFAAICILAPCGASAHKYKYHELYAFCSQANCPDGSLPYAGLTMDQAGNLYGTTTGGGANASGTVFELVHEGPKKWKQRTLYDFCSEANCTDGALPLSNLILDTSGNLYGTAASRGAHNSGVVFKLDPNASGKRWRYTDLYDFCTIPAGDGGCEDGWAPSGNLTYEGADTGAPYDGNAPLYGATRYGGDDGLGFGVVFKLNPGKKDSPESVVSALCRQTNCADGAQPWGGVIMSGGVLYGTTKGGGSNQPVPSGVVFRMTTKGKIAVLYTFCPNGGLCLDGATPMSPLLTDLAGNLVGTTYYGGANDAGTVFQISGGSETVLHDFCSEENCADSKNPTAGLIMDPSGHMYGTGSGYNGASGTVFQLDGSTERDIYEFCCGHVVTAGVNRDTSGNLFGVSYNGGNNNSGSVFELEY